MSAFRLEFRAVRRLAGAVGLALLLSLRAPAAHAQLFAPPLTVQSGRDGTGGNHILLYDFNGDGLPDLVTDFVGYREMFQYTGNPGGVTVQYGNGDGTFQARQFAYIKSTGIVSPVNLSIGDFDGNGQFDILAPQSDYVAVSQGSSDGTVSPSYSLDVFRNTGTFGSPDVYIVPFRPTAVAVVDFDGDGFRDVAVTSAGNLLTIYHNLGNGLYLGGISYLTGGSVANIRVGDLNGDGFPDLLTVNTDTGNLSVFLNYGDGTFADAVNYPVGKNLTDAQLGDLDGDGALDIVALQNGSLKTLLNDKRGGFALSGTSVSAPGAATFLLGDFDRDGILDAMDSAAALHLHLGTAPAATPTPFVPGSGNVAIADLNNDGFLDAVVNNQVYLARNNTFTLNATVSFEKFATGPTPPNVTFTFRDLNGVTKLVAQHVQSTGTTLSVSYPPAGDYIVHVKALHYLAVNVPIHAVAGSTQACNILLHIGDADGDNRVDLADFSVLINAYGGSMYDPTSSYDINADLNSDGNVDINDFAGLVTNFGKQGDP